MLKLSVIIPTRNRPDMVKRCLKYLFKQNYPAFETIVVDASDNNKTREIVLGDYPGVKYLFLPNGKNKRPGSKNLGIKQARGDIIAFIDDDSIVQQGWLKACAVSYTSDDIGGVGGIIIDTNLEKEGYNSNAIGKLTFNGVRIGNFHKNPGRIIEVDHLGGGNMSFRKNVLEKINGFDANYTGSNVLEETDLCVRVRRCGYKILFNPGMSVIHTAARRESVLRTVFTFRREFYITRNSVYFMLVNFGFYRAMAYILLNDTGIVAFLRWLKLRPFMCIFVSIAGKCVGCFVAIKYNILNKKPGRDKHTVL